MRIISKQHDYYDCVQRYGVDLDAKPYLRKREEVVALYADRSDFPYPLGSKGCLANYSLSTYEILVGFCGTVYPLMQIEQPYQGFRQGPDLFCYSPEEVNEQVRKMCKPREVEYYETTDKKQQQVIARQFKRKSRSRSDRNISKVRDFFEKERTNAYDDVFKSKRCPVWVAYHNRIVFNETLKELEFYRIVDPNAAYQAVSMWMSNLAYPEVQEPEISDELHAQKRGFNEWSFRTPPSNEN